MTNTTMQVSPENIAATVLFARTVAQKTAEAHLALALVPGPEIDQWLAEFHAEADLQWAMTLKDRLDGFRDQLGVDHYRLIAQGPSLAAMLDQYDQETRKAIADRAVDRLMTLTARYPTTIPLERDQAAAYFGSLLMGGTNQTTRGDHD